MQQYTINTAHLLGFLLTALALLPLEVYAENFERGQELFQDQCVGCHGELNFASKGSKVKKLSDLHKKISSWATHSGTDWSKSEIDDVMDYLNKSFYHFKSETD